jgi:hypothetical protein
MWDWCLTISGEHHCQRRAGVSDYEQGRFDPRTFFVQPLHHFSFSFHNTHDSRVELLSLEPFPFDGSLLLEVPRDSFHLLSGKQILLEMFPQCDHVDVIDETVAHILQRSGI